MTQPERGAGGAAGRHDQPAVLALDFGGTQLRAAVVLADGTLRGRGASRTPQDTGAQGVVDGCLALLGEAAKVGEREGWAPQALGISAPGPLDPSRGLLLDPPNLDHDLWNFALRDSLSAGTGLPAVLDKDTNVAALAEGRFGAARGLADYVYMTVSTGVGGAVVSGGRLVTGADGAGGELGHLMVDPAGPACGCGVRGHLEAISSGTGIAREVRRAVESGQIEDGTPLAALLHERGPAPLEARDVAAAEDRGDRLASSIMDAARYAFASAMVTVVNVFNPQRVIVGGGIALAQGERLLEPARRLVAEKAFRVPAQRVQFVLSELGDDVGLVGAQALVDQRLGPFAVLETRNLKPDEMAPGQLALTGDAPRTDDSDAGTTQSTSSRQFTRARAVRARLERARP
jgi:glucokinase